MSKNKATQEIKKQLIRNFQATGEYVPNKFIPKPTTEEQLRDLKIRVRNLERR